MYILFIFEQNMPDSFLSPHEDTAQCNDITLSNTTEDYQQLISCQVFTKYYTVIYLMILTIDAEIQKLSKQLPLCEDTLNRCHLSVTCTNVV